MEQRRRIAGLCAAVLLVTGALSSCGGETAHTGAKVTLNGDAVYPLQCDDTLTYWVDLDTRLQGAVDNLGATPFAKELEKRTGVKVEYVHPQAGQTSEQFNIMLASNELPDLVTSNWAGYAGGADTAIEEDYIYKLNDAIEKYAPALSAYLKENPDVDKKIKTDGGNYFVFPFVRGEQWMACAQGLILRKDWLDKLGMNEPKTLDELETVLRGFKTLGANSPLVLSTPQLQMFFYAYGMAPDFYIENGKVHYSYAEEKCREVIQKIADWYKEGLLDNNLVSVDTKYIQSRILNGEAGAYYGYVVSGMGALLDAKPGNGFALTAVAQPTKDGGKPEYGYAEDTVLAPYAVAISTNCKNLELAARFLDYGYTDEGHMLYNFGIEGESYELKDRTDYEKSRRTYLRPGGGALYAFALQRSFRSRSRIRKAEPYLPGAAARIRCLVRHQSDRAPDAAGNADAGGAERGCGYYEQCIHLRIGKIRCIYHGTGKS